MDSAYFIRFSLTEPTKGKDNTQIENTTMHRITAIQESLFSIYAQKIVDFVTIFTLGIGLEQHICALVPPALGVRLEQLMPFTHRYLHKCLSPPIELTRRFSDQCKLCSIIEDPNVCI